VPPAAGIQTNGPRRGGTASCTLRSEEDGAEREKRGAKWRRARWLLTSEQRGKGEGGGAWCCAAPRGGRRKSGSVLRALEQGEGLGAGSGRSSRRQVTVRETGQGARWWGFGVARAHGPAQEERGAGPGRKKRICPALNE
jgi:hypothetical protein